MKNSYDLVAGIDYPRSFQEFDNFFANEEACRKYIVQLRWPQGYQCPRCYSKKAPWITTLLKRWLLGIHQGAVRGKHLDYYLNEYTFRFNRRTSKSRGLLFYRLMEQAVCTASTPYRALVDETQKNKSNLL